MREKMKGGIEHPVVATFLVILGVLVVSLTIGFYLRSAVTGEPIQVKTYTEYRWMNYFPSSVLFYLSYLPETWDAINEVAQLPCDEVKLRKRTEFYNEFSPKLSEDYKEGFNKFNELMGNLEEHTKKEKHSYIIKDEKGLVISLGLPGDKIDVLRATVFPEEYPYNCFHKDMPIFSKEVDNTRVKFIFCCGDIINCYDYLAAAGRNECVEDPCGIGPCKLDICGNIELMDQRSAERYRIACLDKKEGVRVCVSDITDSICTINEAGLCSDGLDNDCDGFIDCDDIIDCLDIDNDGDGYSLCSGGADPIDDCDDNCATCYPGSTEYTCAADGKDQDCDGEVDEWDFGEWSNVAELCGNYEESAIEWLDRVGEFPGCPTCDAVRASGPLNCESWGPYECTDAFTGTKERANGPGYVIGGAVYANECSDAVLEAGETSACDKNADILFIDGAWDDYRCWAAETAPEGWCKWQDCEGGTDGVTYRTQVRDARRR